MTDRGAGCWESRLSGNGELSITGLMGSIWLWGVGLLGAYRIKQVAGFCAP